MKHTLLIIYLLSAIAISLSAQEPKFRHLDVADGLPSSTVYQVFQDSKGYLWFSTEAGVTRFDGTYVENFTMDDDLADNEVFGLFEDSQGRIWARSYNGRFSFFQDEFFYNSSDLEYLEEMYSVGWVTQIFEDNQGYLYFALNRRGFIILTPENEVIKKTGNDIEKLLENYRQKNNISQVTNRTTIFGFEQKADNQIRIITGFGEMVYNTKGRKLSIKNLFKQEVSKVHFVGNGLILGTQTQEEAAVFQYTQNQDFSKIFDGKTIDARALIPLSYTAQKELWMGSLGDGIFLMNNFLTEPKVKEHYLEGKAVSYFLQDIEQNYWFSTLGDGVYMLPKNRVLTYTTEQGLGSNDLYAVIGDCQGNIFVGTGDGYVNIIDKDGKIQALNTINDKTRGYDRITDILVDDNKNIWASSDLGLTVFGRSYQTEQRNIKTLTLDRKGNVYYSNNAGIYKVARDGTTTTLWDGRADALSPQRDGSVWIGTNQGLYLYDGDTTTYRGVDDDLFKSRVSDLATTPNDILCICTYGNGIILKKGNGIRHLTTADGLVGNVCRKVFIEEQDNTIWMATNTGISQFRFNNDDLAIEYLVNYSEADNLASNDIRDIYEEDNKVWVATSEGLSYFTRREEQDTAIAPPIYITNIKIWEQDTSLHEKYSLPYNKNNIRISFTGISFTSGYRIRYMYKMEGVDKDWVYSSNPEAQYPILQPGSYTFRVKAINVDQVESIEEAVVKFVIHPPWWKTAWFRLLALLTIGVSSYFIVNYTIRNRKQKEELRRKIVESEQMALRAQMNPHFVFNALNSIQHFITMEDEMSANYYLTRFSKLIRQVLENSKHSFISVNEEIETLKLYLELEMLRFEGKFEYKIEIDDEIDTYDTQLPSMIIQPFLENAIWHGLMPKEGDPQLYVEFKQDDDFIICVIEDNGIGRKASAENNKGRTKKHKSTGISNTVKRLALLSNVKDESTLMQITDLEEDGKALGTIVTLKIPFR